MLSGIALTLVSLASVPEPPPEAGTATWVARVNGRIITTDEFLRALAVAAQSGGKTAITPELRRKVLDDLIADELLVDHALALDLAGADPAIRRALIDRVAEHAAATRGEDRVVEADLRAYYETHREELRGEARMQVERIFVRGGDADAEARARTIHSRLRDGEAFDDVRHALGEATTIREPEGFLPPSALREILGPTAAAAVEQLDPGEMSEPVRGASGFSIVRLVDRRYGPAPPFEAVEETLQEILTRDRRRRAVDAYVAELRATAEIDRSDGTALAVPMPTEVLSGAGLPSAEAYAP
jgi:hypothetical protein